MIKLYGGTFSRAAIVKWYLEELNLPYEFVLVDLKNGEHFQPEYTAIHPFSKVPAIDDNGFTLWESGAILTYLASKHDPNINTPEKAATLNQWILFANSTFSNGLFVPQFQAKDTPLLLGKLNEILGQQPFVMGEAFSAADIAVGSLLNYVPMVMKAFDFSPYPQVIAYMQRLQVRPGYKASLGQS